MKLSDMEKGCSCTIKSINGDENLKKRLRSLGIEKGEVVKILETSIGSSNIQILCKKIKVGLRDSEAEAIEVVGV